MYPPLPAEVGCQSCERIGLYCITITWQQIFKSSLYITVVGVLLHETAERTHRGR